MCTRWMRVCVYEIELNSVKKTAATNFCAIKVELEHKNFVIKTFKNIQNTLLLNFPRAASICLLQPFFPSSLALDFHFIWFCYFFSNSCVCTLLWLKFKRTAKSSMIDAETFDARCACLCADLSHLQNEPDCTFCAVYEKKISKTKRMPEKERGRGRQCEWMDTHTHKRLVVQWHSTCTCLFFSFILHIHVSVRLDEITKITNIKGKTFQFCK